jgi:dynamin family protein
MNDKQEKNKRLLDIISQIKKPQAIKSFPYIAESLTDTEFELKNNEFRITIVGEFSSGKSTFLNAIIGQDILPHGVNETTATVTYIHNVSKADPRLDKAIVHFRDETKNDVTLDVSKDKSALIDYVTTSENQYNVVQDIVAVDVYVHFADIEDPVVFIDTPGMNGVAKGHREITLHEIRHSHASICLFHLRGMGKSDLDFIKELKKYQQSFFFVLNAIDDLKTNEESYEERMQAFTNDIVNYVYEGNGKPQFVFGISALKALCARDLRIMRVYDTDQSDLTEADRTRLLEESKMPELEKALFDYLRVSEKEKVFYQSICHRLLETIESFHKGMDTDKKIREVKKEDLPGKKLLLDQIQEAEKKTENFKKHCEIEVKSDIEDLREMLYRQIMSNVGSGHSSMLQEVDQMSLYEAERAGDRNEIGRALENFWGEQTMWLTEHLNVGFDRIRDGILSNMQHLLPSISFKDKRVHIRSNVEFAHSESSSSTSIIKRFEAEIKQLQRKISTVSEGPTASSLRNDIRSAEQERERLRRTRSSELQRLGSRPQVEHKTEVKTVKRRGIIGGIIDFFGPEKKIYKTVRDETERRKYDMHRSEIESKYTKSLAANQSKLDALERRLADAEDNENLQRIWMRQIEEAKRRIKEEQEIIEEAKKHARTSYLKMLKKDLRRQIDEQLSVPDGKMIIDLKAGVRESLQRSIQPLVQALHELWDQKKNEYIARLKDMIVRIENLNNSGENERMIQLLAADLQTLQQLSGKIKQLLNGL